MEKMVKEGAGGWMGLGRFGRAFQAMALWGGKTRAQPRSLIVAEHEAEHVFLVFHKADVFHKIKGAYAAF